MVKIVWSRSASKQLIRIDSQYQKAIKQKVESLSGFPLVNLDIKKLAGSDDRYRLRVGNYRVIFKITDSRPVILEIQEVTRRQSKTYWQGGGETRSLFSPELQSKRGVIVADIQFITDANGNKQAVILSIEEYNRLIDAADRDEDYEPIPYTAGQYDDETIPHDVVSIMVDDGVSLQAAWRIYRRLSQKDVAEKLGMSQAAVSQMEKSGKPRKATLERLAELYDCRIGQIAEMENWRLQSKNGCFK